MAKKGKRRYVLHIQHCIDSVQVNRDQIIYRLSDDEARCEFARIHSADETAHEGYMTRGRCIIAEFCKYV